MNKIVSIFANQKKSIESVVAPYMAALYSQAFQYTGEKIGAEDLLQDMLVYALEHEERVLSLNPVKPWLMRCLYHRFIDNYRKRNHERQAQADYDTDLAVCKMPTPEESCLHREVLESLAQLAPDQRVAVSLFDIDGYSLDEIVHVMGIPLGTVKSHLHRGRKKLKRLLSITEIENSETVNVRKQVDNTGDFKNELR